MALIKINFGFHYPTIEVITGIDLRGKRAMVTRGASGIRLETQWRLAKSLAKFTITTKNITSIQKIRERDYTTCRLLTHKHSFFKRHSY